MPAGEVVKIRLVDGAVEPTTLTITPGTTVRWINETRQPQTITSVSGDWDSGDILPGKELNAIFKRPGTFEYSSRFQKNLKATIIVK
jgi:plastocyanin